MNFRPGVVVRTLAGVPAIIYLAALSVVTIAGFFGDRNQLCELCSHFRFLYLLLFLPGVLLLLLLRNWWLSVCFGLVFLLNAAQFFPFYFPAPHFDDKAKSLKVMQMNLWGGKNTQHDAVINSIKQHSPDIVGFSEITANWATALNEGLPEFKYRLVEPQHGGIALYSKFPLVHPRVLYFGSIKRPRIESDVRVESQTLSLILAHPVIPKLFETRNDELAAIAKDAAGFSNPVIVFGDLNCSPWSYYFTRLLESGNLKDTEVGFGFHPTWNTQWYFPSIPIDHFLVSKSWIVEERAVCRPVGSDHLPVFIKLGIPNAR